MKWEGTVIGIDPGKSGAIAFLYSDGTMSVWDMPSDRDVLVKLVQRMPDVPVFIEKAQPMQRPGQRKQGLTSTANYMREYGILLGMMLCVNLEVIEVPAQRWKRKMKCTAEKEQSLVRCLELFGDGYRDLWFGSKMGLLDGRCEAALIAAYGRRTLG